VRLWQVCSLVQEPTPKSHSSVSVTFVLTISPRMEKSRSDCPQTGWLLIFNIVWCFLSVESLAGMNHEHLFFFVAGIFWVTVKEKKEVRESLREQGTGKRNREQRLFPNVPETRSRNTKGNPIDAVITYIQILCYPPKNGEIALWLVTDRWYVVKCVSQKRNNKNQWYNISVTFIFRFRLSLL